MTEGGHHSIGEVLSLLKDEFPDITISKIRFLESQGLIDPERTPSGYRKFYDHDIDRLRWILTQQRDNYLPLKVMKQRILEAGFDPVADRAEADEPAAAPEPALFRSRRGEAGASSAEGEPAAAVSSGPAVAGAAPADGARPMDQPEASVSLTAAELATAAQIDVELLSDLIDLGLIEGHEVEDGDPVFDHEALVVANAAAAFSQRGLEARHLRMFKIAAEREAGVLEQLLAPLSRRTDGSARAELNELVELGEAIHRSILRRLLGPRLG
jgi:DNA-binding transcriptional MerR regulator